MCDEGQTCEADEMVTNISHHVDTIEPRFSVADRTDRVKLQNARIKVHKDYSTRPQLPR